MNFDPNEKDIPKNRPRPNQAEGDLPDHIDHEDLEGELDKNEKPPRPNQAEGNRQSVEQ